MTAKFKRKKETFILPENSEQPTKSNILVELLHQINSVNSAEKMLDTASDYCFKLFQIDGVAVFFPDEKEKYLVTKILKAKDNERLLKAKSLSVFQRILLSSRISITEAYHSRKTIVKQKTLIQSMKKIGIKTVIALPLVTSDRSIGVLGLGYGNEYVPTVEDLKVGELLASHLATSLYSLELIESVKRQNEWLKIIQENIREGFSLIGADDVVYYANKVVGKLFGTTESIVGKNREEVVKDWTKYHRYKVERFFDSDLMKKIVFVNHQPFLGGLMKVFSNPVRFVEANYYPVLRKHEFIGMAAAYRDVTAEKLQEKKLDDQMQILKTEKERSEAIIANVEEGICLLDKDFNILHMNNTAERMSGWTLVESLGKQYYKLFNCHTKNQLFFPEFSPLSKIQITKEAINYEEYLHTNRLGEESWVGVSAAPILDEDGEVKEVVLVIRDISALKEIEKAKSEFVSIASHELRTPLTVINGYLNLLRDGDLGNFTTFESRQRLREVLDKVAHETSRLTLLVSDLLNVSRIEENRITLNRRRQELGNVIKLVIDEMKPTALSKDINLKVDLDNFVNISANFDADKINQVLINLIDNAMKFTPNGGSIFVDCWQEIDKVFVQVRDNGVGIPSQLIPVVFEKFQQVPGSYLKENRGTGLGLFIVRSLVELHNGGIEIDSVVGKGTKVTFYLPT